MTKKGYCWNWEIWLTEKAMEDMAKTCVWYRDKENLLRKAENCQNCKYMKFLIEGEQDEEKD